MTTIATISTIDRAALGGRADGNFDLILILERPDERTRTLRAPRWWRRGGVIELRKSICTEGDPSGGVGDEQNQAARADRE
jgi:hypothetical protein